MLYTVAMAGGLVDKTFTVIRLLSEAPDGLTLAEVADLSDMPKSAVHRLLGELIRLQLVRQDSAGGSYFLSMGLLSIAFQHLARIGVVDASMPILEKLAKSTGELVRLGIVDFDRQVWVAKAQGAKSGLIYDPQMGDVAHLSCMASGHAWLAYIDQNAAIKLVGAQGLYLPGKFGPNAPRTLQQLLDRLEKVRSFGYAIVIDSSAPGMSAIAAPVFHPINRSVVGTVSVGGPTSRLDEEKLHKIAPEVLDASARLSDFFAASPYLISANPHLPG